MMIAFIVGLTLIIGLVAIIVIRNNNKKKLKKQVDDLYVRFNTIKTIPLAFKLNKAQTMAKRNEETAKSVQEYYEKYENAEKHINEIQDLLNDVDDQVNTNGKDVKTSIENVDSKISDCEKEVNEIDNFLNDFSKKENEQRDYSSKLKEKYRIVKTTINNNSNALSIAYDGLIGKLGECEELFSSSEEWMYASDYLSAQADLEKIDELLDAIKVNANAVPKLVKDTKGVLPLMLDEAKREYALTKQRGVNIDHLNVDNSLRVIEDDLNDNVKKIMAGETEGLTENVSKAKNTLNDLIEELAAENRSYKEAKETNEKAFEHIKDLEKVENYVRVAYDKDSARFGLEDLKAVLKKQRDTIEKYKQDYRLIAEEIASSNKAASQLLLDAEGLNNSIEADIKNLYSYKLTIDKSTDGEARALTQLTKLQLVVSEVETKIAEYNLPNIADSYHDDLSKSREYIASIRKLTNEVPINIDELNATLDESIDFIYKFYNNVNNIVGMAVMVENAIVFGNKYRSSYPEIDRELSKAEFQYLNGEYTKSLKTAITCMETLFPEDVDEKILENA